MPEPTRIYIVYAYAHFPDGTRHALVAFWARKAAQMHVQKCTRHPTDDRRLHPDVGR